MPYINIPGVGMVWTNLAPPSTGEFGGVAGGATGAAYKPPKAQTPARGRDWEKWQRANLSRPRKYTVTGGDNWSTIAERIYGDSRMAYQLAQANPGVLTLHAGMDLRLPRPPTPGRTPYVAPGWGGTGTAQPAQPVPQGYAPKANYAPVPVNPLGTVGGAAGARSAFGSDLSAHAVLLIHALTAESCMIPLSC